MKLARTCLIALCLIAGCNQQSAPVNSQSTNPDEQPQSLPTINVAIGGKPVALQVADDDKEREKGLMFAKEMPLDHGMIFVFEGEAPRSFWMKNTPIDLDIIYLDRKHTIVSIKTMHAYSLSGTPSDEPAKFAIELNAGEAKKLDLKPGQKLDLPASIANDVR